MAQQLLAAAGYYGMDRLGLWVGVLGSGSWAGSHVYHLPPSKVQRNKYVARKIFRYSRTWVCISHQICNKGVQSGITHPMQPNDQIFSVRIETLWPAQQADELLLKCLYSTYVNVYVRIIWTLIGLHARWSDSRWLDRTNQIKCQPVDHPVSMHHLHVYQCNFPSLHLSTFTSAMSSQPFSQTATSVQDANVFFWDPFHILRGCLHGTKLVSVRHWGCRWTGFKHRPVQALPSLHSNVNRIWAATESWKSITAHAGCFVRV